MSLPMDATKEDIKKQYRRLCLQWHPDKSDGGRERFEQLQVAHRFLTDDAQREEYDFGIWTDRPARHHTKKRDKVKDSWNDKNSNEEDAPRNHYNWGDRHLIEDEKVESIYWGEEGCPAWLREKRLEYQRKHFGEDYIVPWRPSSSLFLVSQTCRSSRDKNACSCADWWLPLKVLDSIATCYPMQKNVFVLLTYWLYAILNHLNGRIAHWHDSTFRTEKDRERPLEAASKLQIFLSRFHSPFYGRTENSSKPDLFLAWGLSLIGPGAVATIMNGSALWLWTSLHLVCTHNANVRLGWFQVQKATTDDSFIDVQGKSVRLRQTSHPTCRAARQRPSERLKNQIRGAELRVESWTGICKFRFGPPLLLLHPGTITSILTSHYRSHKYSCLYIKRTIAYPFVVSEGTSIQFLKEATLELWLHWRLLCHDAVGLGA